jgi:AcrR family transcriptional regulator
MSKDTKQHILKQAMQLFALQGSEGVSMRILADKVGISSSVLYHYFSDKNVLLKEAYYITNATLGSARAALPSTTTAEDMLRQRILFQLDHAEEIVFVLKYFLSQRPMLPKVKKGYVPEKATLHIEEVLEHGKKTGEFHVDDIEEDAKVITHAINGFVLEFYPATLSKKEKEALATLIQKFLLRALMKGGEKNE